ncbi:glycosyltransferase family 39 protein [bacterium]|nr:glycosyltransferase family 39 protein [candidate division CSSED10-310 bacterium]
MKQSSRYILVAILFTVLPRFLRILYGAVRIEDPNYVYGAFLIFKGQSPYIDFAMPNLPVLEQLLALLYRLFGPSYRIAELLTALGVMSTALLLYAIGRRLWGVAAGLVAAFAYSWHPLVFRYHLFDREIFTALAVAAMVHILVTQPSGRRRALLTSACIIAGFACKQTMAVPAVALGLFLLSRRSLKELLWTAGFTAGGVGVLCGAYYLEYGQDFLLQSLVFHFIKGQAAPVPVKMLWFTQGLHFILPMGLLGLAGLAMQRRSVAVLLWALGGLEFLFDTIASATLWPHYLIPALVPLALAAGWVVHAAVHTHRFMRPLAIAAGLLGVLVFAAVTWRTNEPLLAALGFSGVDRAALMKLGARVRDLTPEDGVIIAPPLEALVCRRVKLINFKDNWGVMQELRDAVRGGRRREFNERMASLTFAEIRRRSANQWLPLVAESLRQRRIAAVIVNYELPLDQRFLENCGYRKVFDDPPVWIPGS